MKKRILKVRAVIFDMDGVITHTMPDHYRAWEAVLKKRGVHVNCLDIYSREGQKGSMSVFEIFKDYGKTVNAQEVKEILEDKEKLFKKITRKRFIPGTRRFIKNLYRRGFPLGLVTGTSRHELHRILPGHIYDLFSVIITGTDVKNGKPHPEPFIKCLKALKIMARDAVVLENAPFGIESAKKAGIRCLALETSLPARYLKKADLILKSISDLEDSVCFKKIDDEI